MKTAHEAIAAMKAELERRKAIVQNAATQIQNEEKKKHYFGIVEEYVDLLAFLDTLPEQEHPIYELNQILLDWVREAKTDKEHEARFEAHKRFFELYDEYMEQEPEQPVEKTSYDAQKYTPSPLVNIEDVARVQFASHAKVFDKKRKAVFDWEQFKEAASIFYGFGKKDSYETKEEEQPVGGLGDEAESYWIEAGWSKVMTLGRFKTIAKYFYELGCRRTAEKYDEIEYNRRSAEEAENEEFEKELHQYWLEQKREGEIVDGSIDDYITVQEVARHFAEWGAEHLKR